MCGRRGSAFWRARDAIFYAGAVVGVSVSVFMGLFRIEMRA
ncbi:hypothetical protein [Bartonella sp. CR127HXZ]